MEINLTVFVLLNIKSIYMNKNIYFQHMIFLRLPSIGQIERLFFLFSSLQNGIYFSEEIDDFLICLT